MNPKPGLKFLHRYWQEQDGTPMIYMVTTVRQGCVYIKAEGEAKAKEVVPLEDWQKVFLSVCSSMDRAQVSEA